MKFDLSGICAAKDPEVLMHLLCIDSPIKLVMCVLRCPEDEAIAWLMETEEKCTCRDIYPQRIC